MLLDLNQKFVGMNGRAVQDIRIIDSPEGQKREVQDLTLLRVISLSLTEPVDQKMSGDDKIRCYTLVLRVIGNKDGMIDLSVEDTAFIKSLIKPKYKVLVVGQSMLMLEHKDIGIKLLEDEKMDPPEDIESDKPDLPPSKVEEDGEKPVTDKE